MKKKISVLLVLGVVFGLLPVLALAASIEGTIQGYDCVITGTVCPTGKEDPYVATQKVFIILTEGKDYYFVPNVDRSVLARHVNQKVRISGDLSKKYNSIKAETIERMVKGDWKVSWSAEEERKMMLERSSAGPY